MWQNLPLFPESASTLAGEVDQLYIFLVAVSTFFAVLICGLILAFSIKYRRKNDGRVAARVEGSLQLELLWTIIPFAVMLTAFLGGASLFFRMNRPPSEAIDMFVVGKQWMWKLQHPRGEREINDLHVPVGQAVRLTMTSEDVIHSFYIPAFRIKRDVVPGRYSQLWFEATKTGVYHIFCAEYCGTKHSAMIGKIYVQTPEEYQQWLSGAPPGEAPEVAGQKLFESLRCNTCHTDTTGARGPSLAGLFGKRIPLRDGGLQVVDEDYIRESIVKPMAKITAGFDPIMPTYEGQVGEEQILQLIAYIKSLRAP